MKRIIIVLLVGLLLATCIIISDLVACGIDCPFEDLYPQPISEFLYKVSKIIKNVRNNVISVYEIGRLFATGDFRGKIFNQTEDSKFIDLLFDIREGNTHDLLCHVTGCEQITGETYNN